MPNRIIRESCRTSKTLERLSAQAERLFWRLVTVADDYGRFEAEASIVRSLCFPLRESLKSALVETWIQELADRADPCITLYQAGGKRYGFFNAWAKHQRIRAQTSKYPDPASDRHRPPMSADGDVCARIRSRESNIEDEGGNRMRDQLREPFDRFWQAYPRKVGKQAAWSLWQQLGPDDGLVQTMLSAIDRAARSAQWQEQGGRFIPHPRTWLSQGRWEDAPMEALHSPTTAHRGLQALQRLDRAINVASPHETAHREEEAAESEER